MNNTNSLSASRKPPWRRKRPPANSTRSHPPLNHPPSRPPRVRAVLPRCPTPASDSAPSPLQQTRTSLPSPPQLITSSPLPSHSAAPTTTSKPAAEDDAPMDARLKFGAQKAISSDMYFGRNAYSATTVAESQSRTRDFAGATSISSRDWFGETEEEEGMMGGGASGRGGGASGMFEAGSSLATVESTARDVIGRVLANSDVQAAGESIRSGALKVGFTVLLGCFSFCTLIVAL